MGPDLCYRPARLLLLLPTAGYRAADFTAARALGAEVVVASERRLVSMGEAQLTLDLCRPEAAAEAIAAVARREAARRGGGRRRPGCVAALAAERLGLSGNPPEAGRDARQGGDAARARRRRRLQPEHRTVGPNDEPAAVAAEVGLPAS